MTTQAQENDYQITVVNIKYGKVFNSRNKIRPEMAVLDVPESISKIKDKEKFEDAVESFAYNTITKKYGAEVNFCQVFLQY